MKFLEQDLEDIIYNADRQKLEEKGLYISPSAKLFRQLRIGNYGVCDLLEVEVEPDFSRSNKKCLSITVYELKKEEIGVGAFLQSIRYVKGIKRYLEKRGVNIEYFFNVILIASKIKTDNDFIFLTDLVDNQTADGYLHNIGLYTYEYNWDGIQFQNHSGYCLTNEGFNIRKKNKKKQSVDFIEAINIFSNE